MKRRPVSDAVRIARQVTRLDHGSIDELYGLEPVFEPDGVPASAREPLRLVPVCCPHCFEYFDVQVDLTGGSCTFVEDCRVCCRPIELDCAVDDAGRLVSLRPQSME
jgi:hypothetical protein